MGCLSIEESRKPILPLGMFFEVVIHLTRLCPKALSRNSQRFEKMLTDQFVPDDVARECSQCVYKLYFVHGLRLHESRIFLIVLFLRAL